MTSTGTNVDARFINKLVPIEDSPPPEELFARLAGEWGKWQISICVVVFVCVCIQSIDEELPSVIAPPHLNFTCARDNSSRCFVNGTKCERFIFKKIFNIITLTETFSLVCDRYNLLVWIHCSFSLGMIVGNVIAGLTADKFGLKPASMIFIPLFCLTGLLLATSTSIWMFCSFRFIHALFSCMHLLSTVAICNNVGNKWRTFALSFVLYPIPVGWVLLPIVPFVFKSLNGIITAISLIPLPVLIPLLYFRDPIHTLASSSYNKVEDCFRKMAHCNGRTFSDDIKIRPVKIMESTTENEIPTLSYSKFFRSKETRNTFLALLWLWFSTGLSFSFLKFSLLITVTPSLTKFIILMVCSLTTTAATTALCHRIQHKIVICVCLFLKNIFTAATLLVRHYFIQNSDDHVYVGMIILSQAAVWSGCATLGNLSPRVLPTCLRFEGVGIFISVFYAGHLLVTIPFFFTQRSLARMWTLIAYFLILGPVSEVLCSLRLWKVHNRELPDFVIDSINFQRYFKPQRYINIKQNAVSLHEIEVVSLKMSEEEHGIK